MTATSTGDESRRLARGGVVSFVGSATSAAFGFALTVLVARLLGEAGAGAVLQAMAVFSIAISLSKMGMDSVAIWLMPRLAASEPDRVRGAMAAIVVISAAAGVVGAGVILVWSRLIHTGGALEGAVAHAMLWVALFVPAGGLVLVILAAIRGLGELKAYVGIGNIGLPVLRPVVVAIVALLGGGAVAVTIGWLFPLPIALVAAVLVARVQVRGLECRAGVNGRWWPGRDQVKQIIRFALPRTISAGLEQSLQWLDVIFVGALVGSAAAGVYGAASRFIAAGLIVDTALRVVVSPRFSALLHENRLIELQSLYRDAAVWLVLFSTPVYVVLALNAPTALSLLGHGFASGAVSLTILCVGVAVTLMAGNIHSVLLMSGRSGWAAFNKAVVLTLNIAGNLILVPVMGIEGAAISWVASMVLDALLATIEVRRFIHVRIEPGPIVYALLPAVVCFGLPGMVLWLVLGHGLAMLLIGVAAGGVSFLAWCRVDHRRLQLGEIAAVIRRR